MNRLAVEKIQASVACAPWTLVKETGVWLTPLAGASVFGAAQLCVPTSIDGTSLPKPTTVMTHPLEQETPPVNPNPGAPIHVDFSQVEDVDSFVTIPEGRYLCRIGEVREGETRGGDLRWALRLEVAEGDLAGRTAAWDGLVWSLKGLGRVKHVLGALGFDVSGALDLEAGNLLGCQALVEFFVEEWTDPNTHRRTERLSVPFLGYEAAPVVGETDSPF